MAGRRQVSSKLSVAVVDWLVRERGFTQEQVAEVLEVTPGYISRVRRRERGLTLEHLERVAEAVRMPLGAMLLAVTPLDEVDPAYADVARLAVSVVRHGDVAKAALK